MPRTVRSFGYKMIANTLRFLATPRDGGGELITKSLSHKRADECHHLFKLCEAALLIPLKAFWGFRERIEPGH